MDEIKRDLSVLQGTTGPDPCTVYVDMKSLRHDR